MYYTSRSRIEQKQTCARKRYLGSEYEGKGLESQRLSLPLVTGSAIHQGVEVLLKIDQLGQSLLEICPELTGMLVPAGMKPIDIAVAAALAEFEQAFVNHEVDATVNESMQFIHDEHAALIEGLLRLWNAHPDGLPWLVAEYEVLEVERWDFKELVQGERCNPCAGTGTMLTNGEGVECTICEGSGCVGGITLRSRADALLRKRSDGGLYVWSLKTANGWNKSRDDSGRHDVQGISEMVCIEERLRRWHQAKIENGEMDAAYNWYKDFGVSPQRVEGTQMTYLLKGRRELNENLNVYQIKSALLHPWSIEAGLLGERSYAHTYWYSCELPHPTGRTLKGGKEVMCEGGKKHNIGTSWSQCNVWQDMPMKEWVAMLLAGEVQPSFPLPTFFINPQPYYRNQAEVEDWIEQVTAQEQRVLEGLHYLDCCAHEGGDTPEYLLRRGLNIHFPQTRGACDHSYGGSCMFVDICFGPSAIADDPVSSGQYRLRTPVEMEVTE